MLFSALKGGSVVKRAVFVLLLGFALLGILSTANSLCAQTGAPGMQLRGTVLDPNRAPISGAKIILEGNNRPRTSAVSDQNGEFVMLLEPGEYSLLASSDGFAEVSHKIDSRNGVPAPIEA